MIFKLVENKSTKHTLFLSSHKNSIHSWKGQNLQNNNFPNKIYLWKIWKFNKKTFDWKYQFISEKIGKPFFWTFSDNQIKIGNPFPWNSSTFQIQILWRKKVFVDWVLMEIFNLFHSFLAHPRVVCFLISLNSTRGFFWRKFYFFWYFSLSNIEHAKKIKFQLSERFYFWDFSIIRPKFCQIFNRKENPIIIAKGI